MTGIFKTFDSITCSLMSCSLRRTRFRASSSRKSLGREQKRGMKGEAGGRGRRKRLQANSTILKNCVCSRTQLLIVAKDCCGTVSDQYINQTRKVFFYFFMCNNSIGKLTGSMQSCVIRKLSGTSVDEEPQRELEAEFKFLIRDCNSQALLFSLSPLPERPIELLASRLIPHFQSHKVSENWRVMKENHKKKQKKTKPYFSESAPRGGGVLPYITYTGMCPPTGS